MLKNAPALFDRLYRYDWYSQPMHDCVKALEIPQQAKVLDLGCGPGNLTRHLAQSGLRVTGMDKSAAMIARAKRQPSSARFMAGDALNIDAQDGRFDVVISASLINVVPDSAALLVEIARVLKPDGSATVLFPTPQFDPEHAERIIRAQGLGVFAAGAIRLWASKARKLDVDVVCQQFVSAGFGTPNVARYLDGGLAGVSAIRTG